MSVSSFDHSFLSKLLGDEQLAAYFTVESDMDAMLQFERALAKVCADHGIIAPAAAREIETALAHFQPDLASLNAAVMSDGVVIPNLMAQLRASLSAETRPFLHFGATSQDVIDTSLMLRLTKVFQLISARLSEIIATLNGLDARVGSNRLMGHTRMQGALPIQASDRIANWREPLIDHKRSIDALISNGLPLQFGGAVGTLEKFGDKAASVRADLAKELGLADRPQFHSQRGLITDIGHLFAKVSGSLGKIGQDIALLAQAGDEIVLSGGGASSAMPHKQNPVAAEVLVAQARFSATLVAGLYQSMVHEQERSGAAWTLEWMLLPQIALSCGASTLTADRLLGSVQRLGQAAT